MKTALTALFDGEVFYPDSPVDLEPNTHYRILVQPLSTPNLAEGSHPSLPPGVPGVQMQSLAGTWDVDDLAAMTAVIEEECEQVNPDEW
jgi:hypothetical protein